MNPQESSLLTGSAILALTQASSTCDEDTIGEMLARLERQPSPWGRLCLMQVGYSSFSRHTRTPAGPAVCCP